MPNAFVAGQGNLSEHEEAMVARRANVLGPAYRLMYETPLHLVRGEGVWLYDQAGRAYLDAYNNVTSLGHCHPRIVAAIREQVGILATNTRYMHDLILDYAEQLVATFPNELSQVMFACTGSEANDLAVRIAKAYTGGTGIIVTENAYHGITETVAAFSPSLGPAVDLGAHVRTIAAPAAYHASDSDVAATFKRNVEAAIADLKRHGIKPAVLIADTLFSSDGVLPEPKGFLAGAVEAIHAAGGLFIADEVQPGFARTGEAMWGFQRHGIVPDLATLGKPMGNGHPVSAVVMRPEVCDEFGRMARYFNTFGGNAVSCAAAMAVLRTIEEERLMANCQSVGAYLAEGIRALAGDCEALGDVRGAGLFIGAEFVTDRASKAPDRVRAGKVVNAMRDRGVLISVTGRFHNSLKIRPPLIFTKDHADHFVAVMKEALAATA
ncbi:aspartate aminotransferase family protein [Jiella sp. MQZ9-1]|uniref:Aspartate aminotransferase family protein n=1 Tax=Jiella flava TaxID=2816857 RepID=A0A939JUF5_9HYPH|nr:aspartate aminotransferase family protein [Jiella flava]MBO0663125.1 aspartate aminotransferase family protein [Jiella flava]MCD2471544.1 aspartate aminotransferase family protein [Jiella flava]